jgi:HKD family nuclease
MKHKKRPFYKKIPVFIFLVLYIGTLIYHQTKELPEGTSYAGEVHWMTDDDLTFLYDLTYQDENQEQYNHEIMDTALQMIEEAEEFLIIDMFMMNDFSDESRDFPNLSTTFFEKIKAQMQKYPDLNVVFITDEVNQSYGSHEALHIDPLKEEGAEIIYTDLDQLRDPNLFYTGIWRMFFQWFGQGGNGWLPNPFGETSPDVTIRSYLQLANAKANHRKAIMTENHGLVMSANIHDASGFHSNVAVQVTGPIVKDMIEAEQAVAAFSGGDMNYFPNKGKLNTNDPNDVPEEEAAIQAQIITEKQVLQHLLEAMNELKTGDEIWIGMFYLSDRAVISALLEAAERGVDVRLILDPNENAFGSEKIGMPNVPIAQELIDDSDGTIEIRWYLTDEEQYHSKIAYFKKEEHSFVTVGSTNFTSRNLDNFNLENNIAITAPNHTAFIEDVEQYFHRIWNNEDATYTIPHDQENDHLTFSRYVLYWIQKVLRFTTY